MSKHTPGPWAIKPIDVKEVPYLIETEAWYIAHVIDIPSINKETIANANLIAAAPDLAAACLQLVQAYQNGKRNGGSISWEDLEDAFLNATTALDKAGIEYDAEEEDEEES